MRPAGSVLLVLLAADVACRTSPEGELQPRTLAPHSASALDDLLGSASFLYSKYMCAPLEWQDTVAGCAQSEPAGSIEWDTLRLPPNTNLLIYGPSLIREIAQLLLQAEQSSPDASIRLVSGNRDPFHADVGCFCGTTFVECASCYDMATWELGQNRRITYVTNYQELQLPSGLEDLDRWLGEQQFTTAAIMGPHLEEYYAEAENSTSNNGAPGHAKERRQMTNGWADQLWDVFASHFEPRKLIHVSAWFGTEADFRLVEWPPPGDEAGAKATAFNTAEELGAVCGAPADHNPPADPIDGGPQASENSDSNRADGDDGGDDLDVDDLVSHLPVPCDAPRCAAMHQCMFVCQRSPGTAPKNCDAAPFVHMTQRFVGMLAGQVGQRAVVAGQPTTRQPLTGWYGKTIRI